MTWNGWLQLFLFSGLLFVLTKPMGLYLVRVLDPRGTTMLDPVLAPLERLFYRLLRIDPGSEQGWKEYSLALIIFSLAGTLFTYSILRLQHLLPLNPQGFGPLSPDLAFNTAISFMTNTNWQNYGGESTLSYFSQMVGLAYHNFVSAAAGIAISAVFVRSIARSTVRTIGNFWVDMVRINLYLLLPLSLIFSVFLVSQGVIQNFKPYITAKTIDSQAQAPWKTVLKEERIYTQIIPQGPMASQVAIKMLGTNGGGFMNANAAHPFENPTPLSNFAQMFSIFLIASGLTYYLGRMLKNQRHGWMVWTAMFLLFVVGATMCWWAEAAGNPRLHALGVDPVAGNMEGKEVRFGIFASALFATITTDASCGAVNAMHDSFTPLGGFVPLVNMQLGEVIFGGVGAGLYSILIFIILAVFLAGLMVGRTPEYLGKKIEAYDVKLAVFIIFVTVFIVLGPTAWAIVSKWGLSGLNNAGPHGFSEILYAFSSANGNNGSAFAGLNANTPWYNTILGFAMLFGRFFVIIPVMALAGNLASKKLLPVSEGTFPVWSPLFVVLLTGTILIVGALTFFPALALGPIVEHFLMTSSQVLF